jgi:hypothetical protein
MSPFLAWLTSFALTPVFSSTFNRIKADYSEAFYKAVAPTTTDQSTGSVIASGQLIGVARFIATGASPSAYTMLVYDYGGAAQKIFFSTKDTADISFDTGNAIYQVTGTGASLKVVIVNNNTTETPVVGGSYEAVKL